MTGLRDNEPEPIRLGLHIGKTDTGWWAEWGRRTRTGATGSAMRHGSFIDVLKFLLHIPIPSAYWRWSYKRKHGAR